MMRVQVRRFACVFFTAVFASANAGTIDSPGESIPFEHLGKAAQERYSGDGIEIRPENDGASLRVIFQKLEATATDTGLWLDSTEGVSEPGSFRVIAHAMGRESGESDLSLAAKGRVVVSEESVHFVRSGLVEEYRVSMDGVRQDFVVLERPAGKGHLRLELDVAGAEVGAAADGVSLTLRCGRRIAYNRLHVTDARGRVLPAQMAAAAGDRIRIVVDDADAIYPVRVDPTFSDADWVGMGGLAGPNDEVRATVTDDLGHLYIGGMFTGVGETLANFVAKWDGSNWSALGVGVNSFVDALVILDGDLYAAGEFWEAGGSPANRVAKWDGSVWSALGSGMDGEVRALVVADGVLFAGGAFLSAGGAPANRIAKWDGSSWSALGVGVGAPVRALAFADGNLYVGGQFTSAGGAPANRIAKWDGASWSALGDGVNNNVRALAVSGTDLYVGGQFSSAGGSPANRIARWDGSDWNALGVGTNSDVFALAVADGDLYVGGSFFEAGGISANRIAKWNGSNWSAVGPGMGYSSVYSITKVGEKLYAGGFFGEAGGDRANNLAEWDGSAWSAMATGLGFNGDVHALAGSDGNVYVGGDFTNGQGMAIDSLGRWDGSTLNAVGGGIVGIVYCMIVDGPNLYVGGDFAEAGGQPINSIAKWDGATWTSLGDGVNGSVYAVAYIDGELYVGGMFTEAGGVSSNNVAKWDGSTWSPLGDGVNDRVTAVAGSGGNIYVGGHFNEAGGNSANHIAKWDGSVWSQVGGGTNFYVEALTVDGDDIYVGGQFSEAGGNTANNIARWDGTAWNALGNGVSSSVQSLAISEGILYVGGNFTEAGGQPASRIAKWDGSSWSPLGSGVNEQVRAFGLSGGDLYVGGYFTTAGGKVSTHFARAVLYEIGLTGAEIEIENGDITPSPSDHTDFGNAPILGGNVTRTFTIASTGGAELRLPDAPTAVVLSGSAAFSVTQQPTSPVAPDGTTTFTVSFAPNTPGDHGATVSIASNDEDRSPFTFAIHGVGTVPDINITGNGVPIPDGADTTSLADHTDFGPVSSLGGSIGRTFMIHNDGTADLVLADAPTAVTLSGSSAFTVSQQASSPVAPDGETSFTVTFAPETPGPHSATVSIASNDPAKTPYTFSISGTATVPQIEVTGNDATIPTGSSEPSLANHTQFGNVSTIGAGLTRTFAIANSGDDNLALTNAPNSVVLAGSDAFTVTQQPGSPISPDGDETFSITFAPATTGPHSATVSIASNDPEKSPYTFAIAGTGIKPTLSILGNGSPVAHGSGNPPSGTHPHFGPAPFPGGSVERTFTLHNTGGAALNFTGGPDPVVIEGSSAFIVSVQPGSSIDPGGEATITIRFLPNAPGLHSATVSITSDDPETGIYTFTVEGIGTQPLISIWDGAKSLANDIDIVRFPTSSLRKRSKPKSLSIRNEGSSDLIDLRVSIAGRQRRDFLISGPSQMVLAPTEVALIKVIFRPIGKGARKATLEIGSNAANGPIFRIQTKGRGR